MLYEQWQAVCRLYRTEIALWDFGSGRRWTFAELDEAARSSSGEEGLVAFPQGLAAEFVLGVLSAWKAGRVVCPLEIGQSPPALGKTPARIVHLKTTSATSGNPRVVAMTASQLKADADNIVQTMKLRREWPNLGAISLAHSYGFSNLVTPLLLHGIPLVIAPSPLPEIVRQAARLVPAVTLPAVPAIWRAWHEARAIPTNVRLAISAGAPLPLALENDVFNACGLKIHNFYGSSECGGIAYDRTEQPRSEAACVGEAMENVQLSANADGCLEVRGAAVAQTYWPEPADTLADGCFRTSDLVEIVDGRVYLRGRLTDQINVAGRKISPETIERALREHEQVRDCLIFGVPSQDAARAEEIVACVATKAQVSVDELRQFLLARVPAWQVPRDWWQVDTLEANQRGKLSRLEWRRRYLARLGNPAS